MSYFELVVSCWEVVGGQKQGVSLSAAGETKEEQEVAVKIMKPMKGAKG